LGLEIDKTGLDLDSATTDAEVEFLALRAETANQGTIVEIGSWKGKSTIYLAKGAVCGGKGLKVYAIDPHIHGTEQIFRNNVKKAGFDNIVVPVVMNSEEAIKQWHQPISLLFIDGAHDYENVKKDFTLWEPHVMAGGTIAFHDKFAEGPCKVIRSYILKGSAFGNIGVVGGVLFATKGMRGTMRNELTRIWLLLLSYIATVLAVSTKSRRLSKIQRIFGKVGAWLAKKV